MFFTLSFTWLGLSFAAGVGEKTNTFNVLFWLLLGALSQLGLFLSTYSNNNIKLRIASGVLMLPFFSVIISSIFDMHFFMRLSEGLSQALPSLAFIVGAAVYLYNYYNLLNPKYNKRIKYAHKSHGLGHGK